MNNKKLIEVDLPLNDINDESTRERKRWQAHPSVLLRYWSRKPLAACRAVIFASLVDDPSACPEDFPTESEQIAERERLHSIIRRLVKWNNCNDENLLAEVRYEIARSVARSHDEFAPTDIDAVLHYLAEKTPHIYDPFCGGGSIPLEAQRLGLGTLASDLNPLAVLLNKAMIELTHPFHNQSPVNPNADSLAKWRGTAGLADDICYYGRWMHEEAYSRVEQYYPKAKLLDGTEATVIAWLWIHTVPCENPACGVPIPLTNTFKLGNGYWARPIIDRQSKKLSFKVQNHKKGVPDGTVKRTTAVCITCESATKLQEYVRQQAVDGNMSETMTAIIAKGVKGSVYMSPTNAHIQAARSAKPAWSPRGNLPEQSTSVSSLHNYGITQWHQFFTQRQLATLTTFSDLLPEVRNRMIQDGAVEDYADALCTYLALAIGNIARGGCKGAKWHSPKIVSAFSKSILEWAWNFAEVNPYSNFTQSWMQRIKMITDAVKYLPRTAHKGKVYQADAATMSHPIGSPVIVMDPPYYDMVSYADVSEFFYVWLRPLLRDIFPELFAGMSTPKEEEMVVNSHRFEKSQTRFRELLSKTLRRIRERCTDQYPSSIFYAYRQQEENQIGRASTGWETMLSAVISAGFQIVGTWPIRTESITRAAAHEKNALASSIVLVCRPRDDSAQNINYGGFLNALRSEMPAALDKLTRKAHIAPVDLAQAAIGPGMEIYSRYKSVKTTENEKLVNFSVRDALIEINKEIDRYHEEQEGEFDSYTRFCLTWLKQYGYVENIYDNAETLAKANFVAIDPMRGRLLTADRGRVQLLPPDAYDGNHPNAGLSLKGITTWEACHLMVYHLNPNSEKVRDVQGAADVGRAVQKDTTSSPVASVETLARVLYSHYDRHGDSANAVLFNHLVTSWKAIESEMQQERLDL